MSVNPVRDSWLVMQYQTLADGESKAYCMQGVFDSKDKAIAVCKTNQYVVFPMTMNEALSDELIDNDEAFFPIIEG